MFEVREVLRLWLSGKGYAASSGCRRWTARRSAATWPPLRGWVWSVRVASTSSATCSLGMVVEAVRPHRCDGHGAPWRLLAAHDNDISRWVGDDLTGVKIHELLERRGVVVPLRTVQRYVLESCGHGRGRGPTVRVADGEPGDELQVDFSRMGFSSRAAGGGWCGR